MENLKLKQSDDMGNNWFDNIDSESVNSGGREWAHIEKNSRNKGNIIVRINSPSNFSKRQEFSLRRKIRLSRHGSG